MHELGVVFHIIDTVKRVGEENQLSKVQAVTLELGEVSSVIDTYLLDCWKWAVKKHEFMEDCQLIIEKIPAITYCEDCKNTYETIRHGRTCPHCGSGKTYLLQGSEFNIKEIEAY